MKLTLEPYQQVMRDHLLTHDRAYACVGLGLGKTATTLSALNTLFQDGEIESVLIVAPKRVARMTWPNELAKWDEFHWMKIEHLIGREPSGKAQIYLINYDRLGQLSDLSFCDVVVFDEITKAKNPQSKRINAIRPLFKHHRRWGLTGTPIAQSPVDAWTLAKLVGSAHVPRSYTAFKDLVMNKVSTFRWVPRPEANDICQRVLQPSVR